MDFAQEKKKILKNNLIFKSVSLLASPTDFSPASENTLHVISHVAI